MKHKLKVHSEGSRILLQNYEKTGLLLTVVFFSKEMIVWGVF